MARALWLVGLLALACHYDRDWDLGAAADATFAAPPERAVVSGGDASATSGGSARACDVFEQDCPQGEACYRAVCAKAGSGRNGASCAGDEDCASGFLCDRAGSPNACRAICANADQDDCDQRCCPQHCALTSDPRLPPTAGYCRSP
jgi:hypothetical protein